MAGKRFRRKVVPWPFPHVASCGSSDKYAGICKTPSDETEARMLRLMLFGLLVYFFLFFGKRSRRKTHGRDTMSILMMAVIIVLLLISILTNLAKN